MSMTDPISDMMTRMRNSQSAGKADVRVGYSKLKLALCSVLLDEGYIKAYHIDECSGKKVIVISLKYYRGEAVIDVIRRISKPGKRVYKSKANIPEVIGGLGISIISTSKGVMSDKKARKLGLGGEVICEVS